jgi:polysaccharide export outer membrane protein
MARHAIALLVLCLGLAGSGLAGCASRAPVSERPLADVDAPYTLDSGDKLRVTVFGQPDLSGEFAVDGSGSIAIPLIPPVSARGLTTSELQASIADSLGRTLLRNPNVSVQVTEFRPFFILGEVMKAGQYPFVNAMTVQSAVAIAGGFSYRAQQDTVHVTRKVGDKLVEMDVDASAPVQPGDTILVQERYF